MTEVKFAPHALIQIRERGLTEASVRQAVASPGQVLPAKGSRKIAQARLHEGGKEYIVRVVYEESPRGIVVVTAYKSSKTSKYWRQE